MKRVIVIVLCVIGVIASCGATYLVAAHFHNKETEQLASQIATLNARIEAIGPMTECYTVVSPIEPGTQFTEDMLVAQSIPASMVNDDFATLEDIVHATEVEGEPVVGVYAKTFIQPGTPLTKSLLMPELITDSLREIDVVGNRWPIGLKTGDYIDFRITYPLGEDFIVLSHKRVMDITEETIKVHMTEEEQHIYQAALVDYYISAANGADIYFTKYVEPGIQDAAVPYYSVPSNIAAVCATNPNIVDAAMVQVKANLLALQQSAIPEQDVKDTRYSEILSGRDRLNGAANVAYTEWSQDYKEEQEQVQVEEEYGGSLIEGGIS